MPARHTLLATAMATVSTDAGTHPVRLLIDPGSELTFVSENFTQSCNLPRRHSFIDIIGIGGSTSTQTRGIVNLTLLSNITTSSIFICAHILRKVSSILPSFHINSQSWPHLTKLRLADPMFLEPRAIDIIIGADFYGSIIKPNIIRHSPVTPIAQLSVFGWLVLGPVSFSTPNSHVAFHASHSVDEEPLQELLAKFWELEEIPTDVPHALSTEEAECEQHFISTHTRDSTGRYVVRIPLKKPVELLGNSYHLTHHSLRRVLRRIEKDSVYGELYQHFMGEYEALGHMVRAPLSEAAHQTPIFHLPHHGVLKPDSTTTKLRVVFNGSCSPSSGSSINDLMHTGPNLLLNIFDVLIRIRHHRHLFATDIKKMYRQISVHPDDWNLQRILWVDQHHQPTSFQLTTVTYGLRAAPFLAVRALIQLVQDEGSHFPLAAPLILDYRYVDDIFGGADTVEELAHKATQLIELCAKGRFPLAKWYSTNPEFFNLINASTNDSSITFDGGTTKLLGLKWSPPLDCFTFTSRSGEIKGKFTKRLISSEVAQIFDPLGLISPVVIRAKILLQELWLHKLNWDDELPLQLTARWLTIREEFQRLASLTIPRWFGSSTNTTIELHGFSDASQLAMSAVVYMIAHSPSGRTSSSLICAKTKVAPLKRLTIPRLELTAALLLSRLVSRLQATLRTSPTNIYLWTDSSVTLTWIKTQPSKWKDFVRNRVITIQELTSDAHWMHVPGSSNPADCASRGTTTLQLTDHPLWWSGPPWMVQPESSWPKQCVQFDDSSAQEARPGLALLAAASKANHHWDMIENFSSLHHLTKITALCLRFIAILRKQRPSVTSDPITPTELQKAELFWVKATQAAFYAPELRTLSSGASLPTSHSLAKLTSFIDTQGVLRVGGRLHLSSLTFSERHPAILPRESRVSSLIIDQAHRRTLHGGTQLTLSTIRQQYWIVGGRAPVKGHIQRCVICTRHRGIRAQQLMGQLPLCRTTSTRPFTHTGIDYAGPLNVLAWKGRGAKSHKGWICVFVCFSSSATHLEVVTDYSTHGFIACYRRFISRRGIPTCLYSDRGTNFIGADASIKALFTQGNQEHQRFINQLSQDQTQWKFNAAAAPHMGGKWEAVVKSTKYHLTRTQDLTLTYEELTTLLTQIEALLNSRPLEALSDDPEDITALTPGHFLIGTALNTLPEPSLEDLKSTRLSRWQLIQQRLQTFWKQWSKHYLHRLQTISKWQHPQHDIKVGTIVLLTDERCSPSKWPLARITQLHPGKDNLTRVVTLKTATTELTRPISKLAVLPVEF